ncbi:GxxExxY protein [bacterium AH-315-P07]|nr:GxxExxY protein [bacterium AH-315-P07]
MTSASPENDFSELNRLTEKVIGCAIEVHRHLGPGLLESAYEECLCHELNLEKISFERLYSLPLEYKGVQLDAGYRLDILIEGNLVLELKAIEATLPIHTAQLLSYLKIGNYPLGLLINFKVHLLKQGITRLAN